MYHFKLHEKMKLLLDEDYFVVEYFKLIFTIFVKDAELVGDTRVSPQAITLKLRPSM